MGRPAKPIERHGWAKWAEVVIAASGIKHNGRFADALGISRGAVQKWLAGIAEPTRPNLDTFKSKYPNLPQTPDAIDGWMSDPRSKLTPVANEQLGGNYLTKTTDGGLVAEAIDDITDKRVRRLARMAAEAAIEGVKTDAKEKAANPTPPSTGHRPPAARKTSS